MRERTHGHVGIDRSGSGEPDARRAVRPVRRVGSGPRPVRPAAPVPYARPDAAPRPVPARPEPGAQERPAGEWGSGVARAGAAGSTRVQIREDAAEAGRAGAAESTRMPPREGATRVARAGLAGSTRVPIREGAAEDGVSREGAARARACGRGADRELRAPRGAVAGPRVLVRHPRPLVLPRGERVRRFLAAVAVALAAAGVVVGLGHLADYTAQARSHTAPVVVDSNPLTAPRR